MSRFKIKKGSRRDARLKAGAEAKLEIYLSHQSELRSAAKLEADATDAEIAKATRPVEAATL